MMRASAARCVGVGGDPRGRAESCCGSVFEAGAPLAKCNGVSRKSILESAGFSRTPQTKKVPIPAGGQEPGDADERVLGKISRHAAATTFSPRSVPMNVVTSSTKRTTIWRRECIVEHSVKR